jgi:hypothetical protein
MTYSPAALYRRVKRRIQKESDRVKSRHLLDFQAMREIHATNKSILALIDQWITDEAWANSVYQYGVPAEVKYLIDRDIGSSPTYTDALLSLCTRLSNPVNCLEIGVSVGKNFWQVLWQIYPCSSTRLFQGIFGSKNVCPPKGFLHSYTFQFL